MISALTGENVSLISGISGINGNNLNFGSHGSASGSDRRNQSVQEMGNDYYAPTNGVNNAPMTADRLKERLPQLREYEIIVGELLTGKPLPLKLSWMRTL